MISKKIPNKGREFMFKRILSITCILFLAMQSGFTVSYAAETADGDLVFAEQELFDMCRLRVRYGEYEYEYNSELDSYVYRCYPIDDSTMETDNCVLLDMNISAFPVNVSEYQYMTLKYHRTGDFSLVRFRSFFTDGTNHSCIVNGKNNEWYTMTVKISDWGKDKEIKQFHITMFPDMSPDDFFDTGEDVPEVQFHSMGFYKQDPRTEEQKAVDAELKAQAEKNRGLTQEYGIFNDLNGFKTTSELLSNSTMESTTNWSGSNASVELSKDAYQGSHSIKATNRTDTETLYYSGIKQTITDVLKENGAGWYKFGAYIKCDKDSPIAGKNYDVRIGVNRYKDETKTEREWVYYYSSHTISDQWEKNENTLYIPWDDNCVSATFLIYGGDSTETVHSDFYVDSCSLVKYIKEDKEETHKAYMFGDSTGNFYPERNITAKELGIALEICSENQYTELNTNTEVTGSQIMKYAKNVFDYTGDIDYSSKPKVTRAEATVLLNAAQNRCPEKSAYAYSFHVAFSDVPDSHSAYMDIIEAATTHDAYVYNTADGVYTKAWKITEQSYDTASAKERAREVYALNETKKNSILNAADNLTINGTKYYFSNKGNDENSGLSPEQPFKSIEKLQQLQLKSGDGVLFERGSMWRGVSISCVSGVTYGAYGTGAKPKLYGSAKDYAKPTLWEETETPNVWQTTVSIVGSTGFVAFNNGAEVAKKVFSESDLTEDYTFYDGTTWNDSIKIYCSSGNPGEVYENIEIAPGTSIIKGIKKENCVFDNLCLMYTGWHGFRFSSVKNITVTNCEIGYIGGTGESSRWGNGLEFWYMTDNALVKNNYIYQVYDTALTNQYSGVSAEPSVQSNITYEGNVIEYCTYGFEFFSKQTNSNLDVMKNITVKDNSVSYTGYGWGQKTRQTKDTSADIKGWRAKNRAENFVINNNVFYESLLQNIDWTSFAYNLESQKLVYYNLTPQFLPQMDGNVFVVKPGAYFGEFNYNPVYADYDVYNSLIKNNIDPNAEVLIVNDILEDDIEELIIPNPTVTVEDNTIKVGNRITAVCEIPENKTGRHKQINFSLCLFDGIVEREISVCELTHLKGAKATNIKNEIIIPEGIYNRTEIRAFVLDDKMNKYTETVSLKYLAK